MDSTMAHAHAHAETVEEPHEIGLPVSNAKLAMWLFLATEIMFFMGLVGRKRARRRSAGIRSPRNSVDCRRGNLKRGPRSLDHQRRVQPVFSRARRKEHHTLNGSRTVAWRRLVAVAVFHTDRFSRPAR